MDTYMCMRSYRYYNVTRDTPASSSKAAVLDKRKQPLGNLMIL